MSAEFREVGIIRDPQPNDVLVVTVPRSTDLGTCDHIGEMLRKRIGCRVVVMMNGIRVGDDGAAAELTALKARRCDGCNHVEAPTWPDSGLWCKWLATHVTATHACNAWTAKEPTT